MPPLRDFITGRWRAVPVLGMTQILCWGTMFYTPVLMVPLIAQARGWSIAFTMGGFSIGLLAAGITAPWVGRGIDRYGGHVVMAAGSLTGAFGFVLLVNATHPAAYWIAWIVLGIAMGANLYDATFASLGRIFGTEARSAITAVTLAGGFASTVGWPVTYLLLSTLGWQGTYLVYAGVLVLVAAPLHAFALPRQRAAVVAPVAAADAPAHPAVLPPHGLTFLLVATAFAAYAFVPSGLSAHLLAIFQRGGVEAATAVTIGALFGPAQVGARLIEFLFARRVHPLLIARGAVSALLIGFAMLEIVGVSAATAAIFMLMFGGANGLITITRGAVPLSLFGAAGYGRVIGRLAAPFLLMQAAAPLVMAFVVERVSDPAALGLAALFALAALGCFFAIRKPPAVTFR